MQYSLDEEIPMVIIQGSFSNKNAVPQSLRMVEAETVAQSELRLSREGTGQMIELRQNCSTVELLNDIKNAGYQLADALCQIRVNPKDWTKKSRYYMVRYTFVKTEKAEPATEFLKTRDAVENDLEKLLTESLWRIRVFLNPFFKNGQWVDGLHAVSVNLEARKPLFLPDGKPVVQWKKDEQNNRIGEAPEPIKAEQVFHIDQNSIGFVEA